MPTIIIAIVLTAVYLVLPLAIDEIMKKRER